MGVFCTTFRLEATCFSWSFGVLLYEMFSAGELPYKDQRQEEILAHVLEGNQLEQPLLCPADV